MDGAPTIAIEPRRAGDYVPLTAWQKRMWVDVQRSETGRSGMRMCPASVRVRGALDVRALQASIEAVVQRHESLRTTIVAIDGFPRQHISPAEEYHLETIDLSGSPAASMNEEADRTARRFADRQIDMSREPLFEAQLLRLSDSEHVLLLGMDHIVSDAKSFAILGRDIWALYRQATQGLPLQLPPLLLQFGDYAVWQEQTRESWMQEHSAYWRMRLTGAPGMEFPLDEPSMSADSPAMAMLHFPLGKGLSERLRELSRREKVLLPMVVLAACAALTSRWCGQQDLLFGFLSHGRHHCPELENMIGFLASRLNLRIEVDMRDCFIDLLKRVDEEFRSAYRHRDFDRVPDFMPECKPQLYFNWIPADWTRRTDPQRGAACDVSIRPFPIHRHGAIETRPFIGLSCCDTDAGTVVTVQYHPVFFDASKVNLFGQDLRRLADEFTRQPFARIDSVGICL